jgi:hypothetical protein
MMMRENGPSAATRMGGPRPLELVRTCARVGRVSGSGGLEPEQVGVVPFEKGVQAPRVV